MWPSAPSSRTPPAETHRKFRFGVPVDRGPIQIEQWRKEPQISLGFNGAGEGIRAASVSRIQKSGAPLRPIGAPAVSFLKSLPCPEGGRFVFPADRGTGHFVGLPRVLARLCVRAELAGVTVQVLRHSFAAVAAGMCFQS